MSESIETLLRKGIAQQEAGRPDLAHALYQKVLQRDPNNADAWHLDGIVAFRAGNFLAAERMVSHAIEKSPRQSLFRITLGNILRAQARYDDALESYTTALQQDAEAAGAYFNRATLLQDMERHQEALRDLDALLNLAPNKDDAPDIDALRAQSLSALGRREDAEKVYATTLQKHPDHIGCRLGLCESLEAQARLDEALPHARHVLGHVPQHWRAATLAATILRRQGDAQAALQQLDAVPMEKLPLGAARRIHNERARAHERLGDSQAALQEFEAQNRIAQQECAPTPIDKKKYLQQVEELHRYFSSDLPLDWHDLPTPPAWGKHPPVFLLGFPRSGTTLLDQILDAHPDIHVLEERPMLLALRDRLRETDKGYPGALANPDAGLRDELRALYQRQLQEAGANDSKKLVINKLPLNLIHVGLIHRVFPEARLIFARRHPCDVLLSCYMQDFTLNNAMANFLSLEDAARLYDSVMSLWSCYRRRFDLKVHTLGYEDLVADFDSEIARLLEFLSLPWRDEVRDFASHARARPLIRTPSYEQVTGALHDRSIGRWRQYRSYLQPHLATLAPHIKSLGYDTS